MNVSNFAHALLAMICQAAVALIALCAGFDVVSAYTIGGALAVGFYWGREVAQVERKAGTPPWWSGFDVRNWSADNWGDFLMPLAACVFVATFFANV